MCSEDLSTLTLSCLGKVWTFKLTRWLVRKKAPRLCKQESLASDSTSPSYVTLSPLVISSALSRDVQVYKVKTTAQCYECTQQAWYRGGTCHSLLSCLLPFPFSLKQWAG